MQNPVKIQKHISSKGDVTFERKTHASKFNLEKVRYFLKNPYAYVYINQYAIDY